MRCRYFLNSFIVKWNSSKISDATSESSPKSHKSSSNLLLHALHVGSTSSLLSLAHSTVSNNTTINALNGIEEEKLQSDSISLESAGSGGASTITTISTPANNFKLPQNLPQIANPLEKNMHFDLPMSAFFILKFVLIFLVNIKITKKCKV